LFAVYLIWGSTYLAIRFAIETLPPFLMGGTRFVIAGTVLYAFRRARGDPAPSGREWRSAAVVGLLLLTGAHGGVVWAEQRLASSMASLLISTVPLWMVVIDALRPGGRRPGWQTVLGVLVGFAGVVILIGPAQAGNVDTVGAIVVVLGASLWALGSLYGRGATLPASPLLGTSMEMLIGGGALVLLGTLTGEWGRLDLGGASALSLAGLAYLIVFGSLVAFSAYTWLLRVAPTPLVSTYAYVNPIVAMVLGHFLAGEELSARGLVAAAMVVGSVALITSLQPAASRSKPAHRELVRAEEG
jgi:drug/metabolite transporter (DMT)-like permease